jgi:hypothetical protein
MLREEVIEAMAAVKDAGFEERQVRLAIPRETIIEKDEEGHAANREYKPFLHISFAYVPERPENVLHDVCQAAVRVFYRWFKDYGVEEVQYSYDIDFAGRFGRFPAKKAA